ncbi:hypothetical protein [Pseudoalteromonas sp. T1lg75]|uniref:hypothetical protein n=1 Tax=Pseudoalteromonas sp. T1lg75 TaxID=2077102 RepID=UPI000CF61565|nr:hypothetical protein [Pseudoalteromonas sp. T1lg75]
MEQRIELHQVEKVQATEMEFYTVSPKKFLFLYIGTFGLYAVYWFFKHWNNYKRSTNEDMWPIMRAIFCVFFAHSLFSLFEMKYEMKKGNAPKSIGYLATIFIIATITSNISGQFVENGYLLPLSLYMSFLLLPVTCWCLCKAQSLANYASDDVSGSTNDKLTFLNYIWLTIGTVFWLLTLLGTYAIASGS